MKVKTSVSLSDDLLRRIDERVGEPRRRSGFIEKAVRDHLRRLERDEQEEQEIERLNRLAADPRHQQELREILEMQAEWTDNSDL